MGCFFTKDLEVPTVEEKANSATVRWNGVRPNAKYFVQSICNGLAQGEAISANGRNGTVCTFTLESDNEYRFKVWLDGCKECKRHEKTSSPIKTKPNIPRKVFVERDPNNLSLLSLKWEDAFNANRYLVEVLRNNAERGRMEHVTTNEFQTKLLPGSTYRFIVRVDGDDRRHHEVQSHMVKTDPSQVAGVHVKKCNGMEITWRELHEEDVTYCVEVHCNGEKCDGINRIAETSFKIGYERLSPGATYATTLWAESLGGKTGKLYTKRTRYEGRLDVVCLILSRNENVTIHFAIDPENKEVQKRINNGYTQIKNVKTSILINRNDDFCVSISSYDSALICCPQSQIIHHSGLLERGFDECNFICPKTNGSYIFECTIKRANIIVRTVPFKLQLEAPTKKAKRRKPRKRSRRKTQVDSDDDSTTDSGCGYDGLRSTSSSSQDEGRRKRSRDGRENGGCLTPESPRNKTRKQEGTPPRKVQNDSVSSTSDEPLRPHDASPSLSTTNNMVHIHKAETVTVERNRATVGGDHQTTQLSSVPRNISDNEEVFARLPAPKKRSPARGQSGPKQTKKAKC